MHQGSQQLKHPIKNSERSVRGTDVARQPRARRGGAKDIYATGGGFGLPVGFTPVGRVRALYSAKSAGAISRLPYFTV